MTLEDRTRLSVRRDTSKQPPSAILGQRLKDQLWRISNSLAKLCVRRAGKAMTRILSDIAPILTVKELAHYLKVHPSTVYRLLKEGKLPAFRVGSDWRFKVEEIDRWRFNR
jgi:excisionase family DNA binding protein